MRDSTGLLEREAELAVADGVLVAARERRGGLVRVAGPPGIGKTGLLAELGRRGQEEGFAVLRSRGSELERDFSYGVVRQLFEPVVTAAADEVFHGAASLASPVFDLATAEAVSVAEASYASLHGLFWLTANLA